MHDKPLHQRILALDYDDCFALAPQAWEHATRPLIIAGFRVWGVTARNEFQRITCPHYRLVCDRILYCAGRAKRPLMTSIIGGAAVWIDDKPEFIHSDYPVGLCADAIPDGVEHEALRIFMEEPATGNVFYP